MKTILLEFKTKVYVVGTTVKLLFYCIYPVMTQWQSLFSSRELNKNHCCFVPTNDTMNIVVLLSVMVPRPFLCLLPVKVPRSVLCLLPVKVPRPFFVFVASEGTTTFFVFVPSNGTKAIAVFVSIMAPWPFFLFSSH